MTWSSDSFSPLDALWLCLALCFLVAFIIHKASTQLPVVNRKSTLFILFQDLIRYGKTKQKLNRSKWLTVFDVPKRWFWHFYAISVCWNVFLLLLSFNCMHQLQPYPSWLTGMMEILAGVPVFDGHAPQLSTVLVQLLLCVHSLRRLLECLFVSVFSDGSMHLVQYLFGLGYYIVLGLTVLCSDKMARGPSTHLNQLDWMQTAGFLLFIAASLVQHQSMVLFAGLRKGKSGRVETLAHRVPEGGWFELVSCPHYFAELLIYISLGFVLGRFSVTWWLVVLYVLFNQALAGQLCHDLYVTKYESYPKHRRAFIPFVL
ncbi:polyprenol reductase [Cyprinodon tularosa]|uniref:polyprenol reductase n=1 Tax=Cyprinodon tularosa TaxID=77115 RepID=UPI0018E2367E|nr:polyprenol reductase [Cyprinodon tularosa]